MTTMTSFWQSETSSLSIRYPLTPILEDDYFGCDDADADDEDEEDLVTQNSRQVFASRRRNSFESFEEEITSEDLFESLDEPSTRESLKKWCHAFDEALTACSLV